LKAIVSDKPGMTAGESAAKFECHDKHIPDFLTAIKNPEKTLCNP